MTSHSITFASTVAFVCLFLGAKSSHAENDNIQLGVNLIKLGCGTGVESSKINVSGNASGSLTLKSLPGATVQGNVTYTKEEAQGLVAALNKTLNADAIHLSEKQIDCMKPYVDRIFDLLFPKPLPVTQSYNVIIKTTSSFIDNRRFGSVDGSISTLTFKIDGHQVFVHDMDGPLGSHPIALTAGIHTFEIVGKVYGAGSNDATLDDNCAGTFTVDHSGAYEPFVAIERKQNVGGFRGCSITPR